MTDLISAAQQALEALEYENSWHAHHKVKPYASTIDAITALKAALEQPEQAEPVEIKPPNPEGATQCIVRWWAETPAGWVGAWDREALEQFVHPPRRETEQPEQEPISQPKPNATTRLQDPGAYDRGVLTGLRQALAICSDRKDWTADQLAGDIRDTINNQMALAQQEQTNPWRDAVDHELSTLHMVASDDPRESVRRLIDWHCAVQIDPLVSSAARELIERGKREALEPEQCMAHGECFGGQCIYTSQSGQPEQDTDCHAQGIYQRSGYSIGQPEKEPVAVFDAKPSKPDSRRRTVSDLRTAAQRLIHLEDMDHDAMVARFGHRDHWLMECRRARDDVQAALEQPEQEPGFWGRVAARQSDKIKQLEAALKAALEQPEQAEPVEKQRDELLEALRECLPYVREKLLNTGSIDAYYTETKASVAIARAEGNT